MQKALKSITNAEKLFTNLQIQVKVEPSNYNESQLNEVAFLAPLGAAALWLLRWVVVKGSWEVLKWMLKRHGGKIAGLAAAEHIMVNKDGTWVKESNSVKKLITTTSRKRIYSCYGSYIYIRCCCH